jgi:integrase
MIIPGVEMAEYDKFDVIEIIPGTLSIYRNRQTKKNYFQVKMNFPGETRIRRSLKTGNETIAKRLAYNLYYEHRALYEQKLPLGKTSFKYLVKQFRHLRAIGSCLDGQLPRLEQYFGKVQDVRKINPKMIRDFENYTRHYWMGTEGAKRKRRENYKGKQQPLSDSTMSYRMTTLKTLLTFAHQHGYIASIPEIPFLIESRRSRRGKRIEYSRRGAFSSSQLQRIKRAIDVEYQELLKRQEHLIDNEFPSRRLIREQSNPEWAHLPPLQQTIVKNRRLWLYTHAVEKGWNVRCGEMNQIKWEDVDSVWSEELQTEVLEIRIKSDVSKLGNLRYAYIIDYGTHFKSEGTLQEMFRTFYHMTPNNQPHQYVFATLQGPGNKGDVFCRMNKELNKLLKRLGITEDDNGNSLSAYSMRHTGITKMMKRGVAVSVIAKSANTSMSQIERHYSHVLGRDVIAPIASADKKFYEQRNAQRANQLSEQITILKHFQNKEN